MASAEPFPHEISSFKSLCWTLFHFSGACWTSNININIGPNEKASQTARWELVWDRFHQWFLGCLVTLGLSEEAAAWHRFLLRTDAGQEQEGLKPERHLVLFIWQDGKWDLKLSLKPKFGKKQFYLSAVFEPRGSAVKIKTNKKPHFPSQHTSETV